MDTNGLIKCSNCESKDFERTQIGIILATEGHFYVNAYACTKCGHVELFEPNHDAFADYLREQEALRKKALKEEYEKKETERLKKIEELKVIINDENSTVKQVREAKEKLNKLMQNHTPRPF